MKCFTNQHDRMTKAWSGRTSMETSAFVFYHQFYVIWVKQMQNFKQKDYVYQVGHHTMWDFHTGF